MPATVFHGGTRPGIRGAGPTGDPAELEAILWRGRLIVVVIGALAIVVTAAIGFWDLVIAGAATCLVVAVRSYVRLQADLRSSVSELGAARARMLAAVDEEREKIERDLHDGVQQRLIGLGIKLELTAERVEGRNGADAIRALGREVDETIQELRRLVRGVNPPTLSAAGLGPALRALGFGAVPPTTVHIGRLGRYSPEIERAVYFSCSEALQNAAKHARGATGVTLSASHERDLHFEIRDDGMGFDQLTTPHGTGLSSLPARLAAVGGELRIRSAPGQGTTIEGSVPIGRGGAKPRVGHTDPHLHEGTVNL